MAHTNNSPGPEDRQRTVLMAIFGALIVLGVIGTIAGIVLESWVIGLGVVTAVVGISGTAISDRVLTDRSHRRARFDQIQRRFNDLERAIVGPELDPLAALDESQPRPVNRPEHHDSAVMRQFRSEYRRARTLWESTVGSGPLGITGAQSDSASASTNQPLAVPSDKDLTVLSAVVDQLEDALQETERVLEMKTPRPGRELDTQRVADMRWGEQFRFPTRSELTGYVDESGTGVVSVVLNHMWPVQARFAAHQMPVRVRGFHLSPSSVKRDIDRLVESGLWRVDGAGYLWPSSVDVDAFGVYRTVTLGSHGMLKHLAPEEIANVMWEVASVDHPLTREKLFRGVQRRLGFLFMSGGNRQVLANALRVGVATRRLELTGQGQVLRGRTTWPERYRRVVERW